MSDNHTPISDAQLDRHIEALRADHDAAGASSEAVGATLAMLRAAGPRVQIGRRTIFERLVPMSFTQRLAAAVMLMIGGMAIYFMLTLIGGSSVAFADVAARFNAARTLSYRSTATFPGQPPMTSRMFMADPDRVRHELPHGIVIIKDGKSFLTLNTKGRTAHRTDFPGEGASNEMPGIVTAFRELPKNTDAKFVGEQVIDGVRAKGFQIEHSQQVLTVWADAKTAHPVRMETRDMSDRGEVSIVMDQFEIDPALDDALFSVEAPEGYKLIVRAEEPVDRPDFKTVEDAVADILRGYADATGGSFPVSLTNWHSFHDAAADPASKGRLAPGRMGGLSGRLYSLPDSFQYRPDGARLGDKDKIIFWYRPGKDSPTYRALYADLHAADVTAEQLPARP